MRNLKKFLALTLAMMMVFGLMVTVNAASFNDAADINPNYATAAEVLAQLGVLKGATDGDYYPNGKLTRAEFAAILYRIHTGDAAEEHVSSYASYAAAFADVPTNAWYAGQVGYCVHNGLLVGDGTNYWPDGQVTSTQVVIGMLRALGYDKKGELQGANSGQQALISGSGAGIINGVGAYNINDAPAARELIAQIAFDTLVNGKIVTYRTDTDGYYDGNGNAAENNSVSGPTLGSTRFGLKQLVKNGTNVTGITAAETVIANRAKLPDVYGCPGATEVYITGEGDVITVAPDPIATYSSSFTGADALPYLAAQAAGASITVYYEGNTGVLDFETDNANGGNNGLWAGNTAAITGYEIEIYSVGTADAPAYRVIVREAYLGHIDNIDEDSGDITLTVYEYGTADSSPTSMEYTVTDEDDTYEAVSAYDKGDYLAVYVRNEWEDYDPTSDSADDYVIEVADLEKVETRITRIDKGSKNNQSTVTADGVKYKVNNQALRTTNGISFTNNIILTSTTGSAVALGDATLYLYNGNIMLVDQTAVVPTNSIYIAAVYTPVDDFGVGTANSAFQGVLPDGTIVTGKIGTITGLSGSGNSRILYRAVNYAIDPSTGAYNFTVPDSGDEGANRLTGNSTSTSVTVKSTDKTIKVPYSGSSSYYFSSNVNFVYISGEKDTLRVDVKSGVQNVTMVGGRNSDGRGSDWVVLTEDAYSNKLVTTVFVVNDAASGAAAEDLIYVKDSTSNSGKAYGDDDESELYLYKVYINGKTETIVMQGENALSSLGNKWCKYTIDPETGAYRLTDASSTAKVKETTSSSVAVDFVEGTYYVTTNDITTPYDATGATVVDLTSNSPKVSSIRGLYNLAGSGATGLSIAVAYDDVAETISLIYITNYTPAS